jgi:hypothetical protein
MVLLVRKRILRTCTPGRRPMYLAPAGSVLILLRGFSQARGIFRFAARRITKVQSPVSGATDVCEVTFEFDNKVFRIHEDPRVTKPYTEEQWAAVMQVGHDVEKDLQEGDVRLTMGGEPTFISIDDFESPEWNTAADGALKRQLAYDLSLRLKKRFAHGGLLHFGQGKWYPASLFHAGNMHCIGEMTVYRCGEMMIW